MSKTPDLHVIFSKKKILNSLMILILIILEDKPTLQSITNQIVQILRLDDDENKDTIMKDLLENGRQSLINYQNDIAEQSWRSINCSEKIC